MVILSTIAVFFVAWCVLIFSPTAVLLAEEAVTRFAKYAERSKAPKGTRNPRERSNTSCRT